MIETWLDTYDEEYFHQIQFGTTRNSSSGTGAPRLKITPIGQLSYDHEDHPNQLQFNDKLRNESGHPLLSLKQSEWKLSQKHNQNFPIKGKRL